MNLDTKHAIALVDNGSLRAESILNLRRLAERLSARVGRRVDPVSMLHSSKVDPRELEGAKAEIWPEYLERLKRSGCAKLDVVPLFFGPSRAVVQAAPRIAGDKWGSHGSRSVRFARPLVDLEDESDEELASIMAEEVRKTAAAHSLGPSVEVMLVDHGSPSPAVARCRDRVAEQMARLLGAEAKVVATSMERRAGEAYAFNEPLLESALDREAKAAGEVLILSMMFLLPGRHAGPGGDISQICEASRFMKSGGLVIPTSLVGRSERLVDLLARRWKSLEPA